MGPSSGSRPVGGITVQPSLFYEFVFLSYIVINFVLNLKPEVVVLCVCVSKCLLGDCRTGCLRGRCPVRARPVTHFSH